MSPLEPPNKSKPLRFGWVSAAYNIGEGAWIDPFTAGRLIGVTDNVLRYWADQGAISCIDHGKKTHRRYLQPELEKVMEICKADDRPTLHAIKKHLQALLAEGP